MDALHQSLLGAQKIGAMAVIVDAIDNQAKAFLPALRLHPICGSTHAPLPAHEDDRKALAETNNGVSRSTENLVTDSSNAS
jgi:hypothetical protein